MDLPQTLHGQLYLLAYDRKRQRCDRVNRSLLGFTLRAAMLTDLYLTGHLEDRAGRAHPSSAARPADPLLRTTFNQTCIGEHPWTRLIESHQQAAPQTVHDQLEAAGWLRPQRRRMLGIARTSAIYDEDMVSDLAARVSEALRNAIDDRPAEPRPLAAGLLGVLGQLPAVLSFSESAQYRLELHALTSAAIEPIEGLRQVIVSYYQDQGGGCGGAGCGGG